jgi:hypothetical protein
MSDGLTPSTVRVVFRDGAEPLTFENATFQIAQPGVFVIESAGQLLGLFPLAGVAGVYNPNGPSKVALASGVTL